MKVGRLSSRARLRQTERIAEFGSVQKEAVPVVILLRKMSAASNA